MKPDLGEAGRKLEENAEKFAVFSRLLSEYNQKFNLTSITEAEEVRVKHFLDSLAGEFLFPAGAEAAEVGSGAGFPSVPLMIARADLSFTLIESTGKKCEFLRTAVRELGLKAEVVCARAEDVARENAYRERFAVVCARAVAPLNTLSEYCLPLVRVGGRMAAYKGSTDELGGAKRAISLLGGTAVQTYAYALPDGRGLRTLISVEKGRHTPAKYPRGQGKERKEPLT